MFSGFLHYLVIISLEMSDEPYFVRKYDGNKYVKHFSCWNQLFAMIFGQLWKFIIPSVSFLV